MAETPQVVSFAQQPMKAMSMEEQRKAVPAYTIEAASRRRIVNKTVKDELGFRIVPTEEDVQGYFVRTLRGDSIFLLHEDIIRMKLDRNLVPLVMEGGDDTPVGMQQVNAAITTKHKQALDVLSKMLESDPAIMDKLLAAQASVETETDKEE